MSIYLLASLNLTPGPCYSSFLDRLPKKATKALFDTYYCIAYQVFHDAFTALEPSIRSRGRLWPKSAARTSSMSKL